MSEVSLQEFCQKSTQAKAAEILGRSQSAICQMLKKGRQISIVQHDSGEYTVYERRIIKPKKRA